MTWHSFPVIDGQLKSRFWSAFPEIANESSSNEWSNFPEIYDTPDEPGFWLFAKRTNLVELIRIMDGGIR